MEVGVEAKAGTHAQVEWRRRQRWRRGLGQRWRRRWGCRQRRGRRGWMQRRRLGWRQWLATHWTSRMTSFVLLGSCARMHGRWIDAGYPRLHGYLSAREACEWIDRWMDDI